MGDRKVMNDVEKAFTDALRSAGVSANVRQQMGERIEAQALGKDVLTGTVTNLIQSQARDHLCRRGYFPSVSCEQTSDTTVDFIFEVDRKRVVVGVSISF